MRIVDNMKKTIKKKKAFTLVELMGVLVIIGVLSAILIPVISNVLKENKEKAYQAQLQNITLAAKNFVSDNMFLMPESEGESISITLGQLKKSGYTEHSIINPKTKQEISDCLKIKVKKINNNYEYIIEENTIQVDNCNDVYNSDVLISGPSKAYVKNGDISSYILMINPNDEEQVLSYTFDNSKLSLGEETDAKYSVVGENGIYKIIIKAKEKEDDLYLTFEDGAITDNAGNNVDLSNLTYDKIMVDNTAPVITFTNNGSSEWTNNAKTKINVSDAKSGANSSTYKYIFSNITSTEPTNIFTIDTEVSHTSGNGEYYLIAKACDNVGNCDTEISNYFNMDTAAPSIPTITLVYEDNNQSYNQSWTNRNIKQIQSSNDDGVGDIYYQYSYDNSSWDSMPKDWIINWDGSWTFYVRACDSLNNCSNSAPSYWIGRDTVAPTAPAVALVQYDWLEVNNDTWHPRDVHVSGKADYSDPSPSATDDLSGIQKYQISADNSSWSDWSYGDSNLYHIAAEGITYRYIRAVDKSGNISSVTTKTIKIDKTAPTVTHYSTVSNGTIDGQTYNKLTIFKITDNFVNTITGHRAHCAAVNASANNPQMNTCYTSSGEATYSAYNRLNYYLNNNYTGMNINGTTDNKIASFSGVASFNLQLGTNMGDPSKVGIQFAIRACDEAGNCSSIQQFNV